jgi:hypothetical protein
MVLQQQPATACVYGVLGEGGTAAAVKIATTTAHNYVVDAVVSADGWKACLPPQAMGGDHTITATCTGCINSTAAVLEHVTFGDVWYCAGKWVDEMSGQNTDSHKLRPCRRGVKRT